MNAFQKDNFTLKTSFTYIPNFQGESEKTVLDSENATSIISEQQVLEFTVWKNIVFWNQGAESIFKDLNL